MNSESSAPQSATFELAQRVAAEMLLRDRASASMGLELMSVGAGHACVQMTVRDDMVNGHGTCHGGFLFTLADSTFALACNSANQVTVAASAAIEFLAPAHPGERLEARAVERWRTGRNGVYDIDVRRLDGAVIALFRGKSFQIGGELVSSSGSGPINE